MLTALFVIALSYLACVIYLQAGYGKLSEPERYSDVIAGYVRRRVSRGLIRCLGFIEVLIAVALIVPVTRAMGALFAASVFAVYAVLMARRLREGGSSMRCGCGGAGSETRISFEIVLRNVTLVLTMLWVASAATSASSPLAIEGTSVAFGVLLCLCYLAADQLIVNRQKIRGVH